MNRKALVIFFAVTFCLAWFLFLIPLAFGEPQSSLRQTVSLITWTAAMWAPGIAAILATISGLRQPLATLNLRRLGERKAYLWAWLLPPLLAILAGIFTWLFGLGKPDLEFTLIRQAMENAPDGQAVPACLVVLIQAAFSLTLAPLFNTLFGLGEELGWRGFLLPQLLPLGQGRAILISGLVWGIWHAPAILQGYNYPSQPVLGVFLMTIFCILMGAVFAWLYLRTRSPWAPALAHGALNATAGLPMLFLKEVDLTWGGTVLSLTGWIGIGLFVLWLIGSKRLPVQEGSSLSILSEHE